MGLLGGLIWVPPVDVKGLVLCIFGRCGLFDSGSLGLAFDGGVGSPERRCGHYGRRSIRTLGGGSADSCLPLRLLARRDVVRRVAIVVCLVFRVSCLNLRQRCNRRVLLGGVLK